MVTASPNFGSFVGILLFILGFLSILTSLFPDLKRKLIFLSNFETEVGIILCIQGGIFFFQGWRMDPILQFAIFLQFVVLAILILFNYIKAKNILRLKNELRYDSNFNEQELFKEYIFSFVDKLDKILFGQSFRKESPKDVDNNSQDSKKYRTDTRKSYSRENADDFNEYKDDHIKNKKIKDIEEEEKIETIFYRDIGKYKKEDLELKNDSEIYKIVKERLLGITKGEIKPDSGEVQYLKSILKFVKPIK